MRAIVVKHAGNPEVLQIKEVPSPQPQPGWVLIRVKAFGLNRAELFTRQGHSWMLEQFEPMAAIPSTVKLTAYSGGAEDFMATPLQQFVQGITDGSNHVNVDKVFRFDEIVEAHRYMEENRATGKLVILVD